MREPEACLLASAWMREWFRSCLMHACVFVRAHCGMGSRVNLCGPHTCTSVNEHDRRHL
jgi:hypothetical protein